MSAPFRTTVSSRAARPVWALVAATLLAALPAPAAPPGGETAQPVVTVGSQNFTEGYLLAEIFAQALEASGFEVDRRFGLGGTLVCYEALEKGEIDVYPEYTGTITRAILDLETVVGEARLRRLLAEEHGLSLLEPLGFNNTYAIALRRDRAAGLAVREIGDLARHPELKIAFSHEFIERHDGWPGLKAAYGLPQTPAGIEHGLAYQAISEGRVDVTDVYSTDGDIEKYDLVLLDDRLDYFPRYLAAPLARSGLDERARAALSRLGGTLDEPAMRALNAEVLLDGKGFDEVAAAFLAGAGIVDAGSETRRNTTGLLVRRTVRHIELTLAGLLAGILVAVPVGVLVYRRPRLARPVVYVAGALQTIPSIALLAFMIPLFGIGVVPAMVALFLYALLPILRNTTTALFSIDPVLRRVGQGMGLSRAQQLRHIELPLAAPTILAGVKTAAVINIGTATLAAFIGAGGLGEPIVTGLALNDTSLIMEGAVPATVLAILTELAFEAAERYLLPSHLNVNK
jgi:osmoprotectant transport system permease protein